MSTITIFTINLNNYVDKPLPKFCMATWPILQKAINECGYESEIKIYSTDSVEWLQFKEDCKNYIDSCIDKGRMTSPVIADAFRNYILSLHDNHIWLDGDIYFDNNFKFDNWMNKTIINEGFAILSNLATKEPFKMIYNGYITGLHTGMADGEVVAYYGDLLTKYKCQLGNGIYHFGCFDELPDFALVVCANDKKLLNEYLPSISSKYGSNNQYNMGLALVNIDLTSKLNNKTMVNIRDWTVVKNYKLTVFNIVHSEAVDWIQNNVKKLMSFEEFIAKFL